MTPVSPYRVPARIRSNGVRIIWYSGVARWNAFRAAHSGRTVVWRLTIQRETPGSPGVN